MALAGRRIYGTETEYGLYWKGLPNSIYRFYSPAAIEHYGYHFYPPRELWRLWLFNGGRYYLDNPSGGLLTAGLEIKETQGTPEYATPETCSVRDVVCWEKAGELIMRDLFGLEGANANLLSLVKHGRGLDREGIAVTSGHHENYSVELGEDSFENRFCHPDSALSRSLVSFLVSRVILHGAGWFQPTRGFRRPRYEISNRAAFMENVYGSSTTSHRAIVSNGRYEESPAGPSVQRLHLILGDLKMSETSLYLTMGTTGLVLRMLLESNLLDHTPGFLNPVTTLRSFSKDIFLRRAMPLSKKLATFFPDSRATAWEMQQYFCLKAQEFAVIRRVSEEELTLIAYWQDVLTRLKEDIFYLNQELDWVIKLSLIEAYLRRCHIGWKEVGDRQTVRIPTADGPKTISLEKRLSGLDLAYHFLVKDGLYQRLVKEKKVKRLLSDEEIVRASQHPPANTRAKIRGEFIHWAKKKHLNIRGIDWHYLTITSGKEQAPHYIRMDNPFAFCLEEWDNLQEHFGKERRI